MTGAQVLEKLWKLESVLGDRGKELEKLIEPYRNIEIPPHIARTIQEEIDFATTKQSSAVSAVSSVQGNSVTREEFDDLADRVRIIEEESGLYDAEELSDATDVPFAVPLPPVPAPQSSPLAQALPSVPPAPFIPVATNSDAAQQSEEDKQQVEQVLSEIESLKNKGQATQPSV